MDILICVLSHGINVIVIQNVTLQLSFTDDQMETNQRNTLFSRSTSSILIPIILEFEEVLICDVVCKIDLNLNQFQFFTQKHQQDYFV